MQGLKKLVLGVILALGFGAVWASYSWNFPTPVTPIAHETLHVHNLFIAIALTLFCTVLALMLYSFWTHRKSRGHQAADFSAPRSRKQWLWVLAPFAGLLILDYGVFGIPAYHAVLMYENTKTDADLVVKVTGSQWLWQYEFPAEGVKYSSRLATPRDQIDNLQTKGENYLLEVDNPLVLPVGKKVRFITTSNDVIHSWWVPAFGVKRDAVPGFLREFWATVDTPGTYRGQCSELCGKEHGFMPIVVKVVPEAEFKQWLASKKTGAGAAASAAAPAAATKPLTLEEARAKGEKVYGSICITCHQANGKGLPGTFPALDGSKVATGPVDEHIKVVLNGRPKTAMVSFAASLSDEDIAAVVTYERNAWGNKTGDVVQAAHVAELKRAP
ncbi:MAG: cytochrome c oxidase subunit II [Burkholderiales bacterium]|nr:cytochrome c oxidase subunit II [Burkholderiales bacterium]